MTKWKFQSTNMSEIARFQSWGIKAGVEDCDGDMSYWYVDFMGKTISSGECDGNAPYHMDAAMAICEEIIRTVLNNHQTGLGERAWEGFQVQHRQDEVETKELAILLAQKD